jgi:hypothetical protein
MARTEEEEAEDESESESVVSEGSLGGPVGQNFDEESDEGADVDEDVADVPDGYTDEEYRTIGWGAKSRPTSHWEYDPKPPPAFPPEGGTNPEYLGLSPGELFMKLYGRPMEIWVYQTNIHIKYKYKLAVKKAEADARISGQRPKRVRKIRPLTPREAKLWVGLHLFY